MEEFDILEEKIGKLILELKKLKSQEGDVSVVREENTRLKQQMGLIKERITSLIKRLEDVG
ncbi:MAG: hypothetical protein AB1297_07840 [bacterium]